MGSARGSSESLPGLAEWLRGSCGHHSVILFDQILLEDEKYLGQHR
jgi:hypothetical protein